MFKLFKNLSKKDYIYVLLCITLVCIHVWLELKVPDYMSGITALVQTEGSKMSEILEQGVKMVICAFASLICTIFVGYFAAHVGSSFSATLRKKIFSKVQNMGVAEIKKFSTSSLITRTTNDVMQVEMLIGMGLQALIKAPIMAVWAILKILNKGFEWSVLVAVCVTILLFTVGILMIIVIPRFKIVQKLIDRINGLTRENLTGIRVIRAFNSEKYQKNKFSKANDELTNMQLFNQRCFSIMGPMMNLVMHGLTLGIYIIGANLIYDAGFLDRITIFSNMVVFSSYGMQVIMSFLMLAMTFMLIPRASISAKRINEVLDEKISVIGGNFDSNTKEKGTIEFKNVSFKYPDADEYILKDISFKVNQGETIAFIGSTGSGKSTLINLIPRFYDVNQGEVLVDGINVKEYKTDKLLREALKEKTAVTTCLIVAQRIGTIKDADKIIVLDKGSIVGQGTHEELMENCKVYKEIALSQLSKEELKNA